MLIGYARVSKDRQLPGRRTCSATPLRAARIDFASGLRDGLRALRKGDVLVVWRLDRLGRNLAHLVNTVQDLSAPRRGLAGARRPRARRSDTTTAAGRLVFGIFAALAEFDRG